MKNISPEGKKKIYHALKATFDTLVLERPDRRLEIKQTVKKVYAACLAYSKYSRIRKEDVFLEHVIETLDKCRSFATDLEKFIDENKIKIRQKVVDAVWPVLRERGVPKDTAKRVIREAYRTLLDEFRKIAVFEIKDREDRPFEKTLNKVINALQVEVIEKRRRNDNRW